MLLKTKKKNNKKEYLQSMYSSVQYVVWNRWSKDVFVPWTRDLSLIWN